MKSFPKANLTAITASSVDFVALYLLVEFVGLYYVTATSFAALAGAFTNFLLNRYWAFGDSTDKLQIQGAKYAAVSGASLAWNTLLVFCLTELLRFQYMQSKVIASLAVGWGWNYPMHRYFVFPKSKTL